jgi:HTH-type transcriptional regulator / antitoxin HigA
MEDTLMKITTPMTFSRMPRNYRGLVTMYMPRAIHDQVDYDNTIEIIDALAGHDLTDEQELYLDTLSTLVEAYEEEHHAINTRGLSPLEALKFLLEENDLSVTDLGNLLGERTLGSKILRGERKIGLTYARILAKRFAVDMGVFLD